jgi:hypothetical protein
MEEEETPGNGRVVGREYGVDGKAQLEEIKAIRAATLVELELAGYYFPPGATEPVPIES